MKKDLISIIIPIYNVEKFLNNCVDSVRNQSYDNLEIILVDDGSPDNCPFICDQYAKKDSRIKVVHKKNGGLSDARNFGLKVATGKYIYFVDSDDYINRECLNILYKNMKFYNADLVACNVKSVPPNYNDEPDLSDNYIIEEIDNVNACLRLKTCSDYGIGNVVWNKLYPKSFFDNVEFPVGLIHEDEAIIYQLVYPANKVIYIHEPLHYYRRSEKSIMRSDFSLKRFDILKALKMRLNFIEGKNNLLYKNNLILYYRTLLYYKYLGKKKLKLKDEVILELKNEMIQTYAKIKEKSPKVYMIKYCGFFYVRLIHMKTFLAGHLKKFKKGYLK